MTLHERTAALRRGLGDLRRRVRGLLWTLGVARTVVFVAVALVLLFFADYLLRLPLAVRWVALLALLAGLATTVIRRLVLPLRVPLDDVRLAARVEAAHPELKDRLSSSLAFARAAEDPDNEDSPALMQAVVEETAALAPRIPFVSIARSTASTRWAMGAVALAALVLAAVLIEPARAATFARRALLLRDVDWPRRTTLQVVDMEPGVARRVTLGHETRIEVRAGGTIPDRVRLTFWETGLGRDRAETVELTPAPDDARRFPFSLQVQAGYEFTVSGGDDDRERIYRIEALTPPAILGLELACTYPAYLGRAPEVLEGGDQRVPEGTEVAMTVRTNLDLATVALLTGDDAPQPLERVDARTWSLPLTCREDLRYSLLLRGPAGQENDPRVDTYWLRVQKDAPPVVRIHTPPVSTDRVPGGLVLIGFDVRDDHRVDGFRLHLVLDEEQEPRVFGPGDALPDGVRILESADAAPAYRLGVISLDLPALAELRGEPWTRQDALTWWVEAVDSAGHTQRHKSDHAVRITNDLDLQQAIENDQRGLRDTLDRTLDRQQVTAFDRAAVDDTFGRDSDFRLAVARAQASQARVVDDLDSLARRLRAMANLYVFNRLEDGAVVSQVVPYFERHLLTPSEQSGVAYRGSLYTTLWTAMQERAIRSGGSLAKLVEMAALTERLASEVAPEAYRVLGALGRLGPDAGDAGRALLDDVDRLQQRVGDGLDRLDRLMREWQTFEGVVRFFKGLRDSQRDIFRELEEAAGRRR